MATHSTVQRNSAKSDFDKQLEEFTLRSPPPPLTCGREYVRVEKLVDWMGDPAVVPSHTSRLLGYAYQNHKKSSHLVIVKDDLFQQDNPYIVVFCILLSIGLGDLIHIFRMREYSDNKLPISLLTLKDIFQAMSTHNQLHPTSPSPDVLAARFNKVQWKFCAFKFNGDYKELFDKDLVIPINKRSVINNKGGTAVLWQIEVLKEFVGRALRERVPSSYSYEDKSDGLGERYHFALKVFHKGNKGYCDNEKEAFSALKEHHGMVQYLGGYSHQVSMNYGSIDTSAIESRHNILLEYGDRDLELFFAEKLPPVLEDEILTFWKNLFAIAHAIKGIHQFSVDNDGVKLEYLGWHADVKPDNILEVEGKFKLADPGFAKFLENVKEKWESDPKVLLSGGTHAFGAPERYKGHPNIGEVNRTIDIWSLGCVFSIAATWVILGVEGIKQYTRLRRDAIDTLVKAQKPREAEGPKTLRLESGEYFHDGREALKEVKEWHAYLRKSMRVTDMVTSEVLDLVETEMLVGNPKERMKSLEVCRALAKITEKIVLPESTVSSSILEFLHKVYDARDDPPATSIPVSEQTVRQERVPDEPPSDRQKRKDKTLLAPLITPYRSYLKAPSSPLHSPKDEQQSVANRRTSIPAGSMTTPTRQSFTTPVAYSPSPPASAPLYPSSTGFTEYIKDRRWKATPQNVFQAREDMRTRDNERKKEHPISSRFGVKKVVPDATLRSYWKERDLRILVDNAESMIPFWGETKYLLETLLMKAEGLDENGVDLTFTLGGVVAKGKNTSNIIAKMDNPDAKPKPRVFTDITKPLTALLYNYLDEFSKDRKTKKLTILVLTDGLWQHTVAQDSVIQDIKRFVEDFTREIGFPPRHRQVSIEFIQLGKDPEATYRLRVLDNGLKEFGIPDFIDTERSTGDVNKMLLGSFEEAYDEAEAPDEAASYNPQSPYGQSQSSHRLINARQSTYSQFDSQFEDPGELHRTFTMQTHTTDGIASLPPNHRRTAHPG